MPKTDARRSEGGTDRQTQATRIQESFVFEGLRAETNFSTIMIS